MSRANPRFHRINPNLPLTGTALLRVTVYYLCEGQNCQTHFDYQLQSGSITSTAENTMLSAFIAATQTKLLAVLAADCSIIGYKCECLNLISRAPFTVDIAPGATPGTGSANHMPTQIAAIVTKQTPIKGQHGRGRNYFPGVPTAFVTTTTGPSSLNGAGTTAFSTLKTQLLVPVNDGTNNWSLCVTQKDKGNAVVTKAQNVTLMDVDVYLGTIRRRRVGKGK